MLDCTTFSRNYFFSGEEEGMKKVLSNQKVKNLRYQIFKSSYSTSNMKNYHGPANQMLVKLFYTSYFTFPILIIMNCMKNI